MANEENLKGKGFQDLTAEKQREIARMGGISSGKARRRKKNMREAAKMILDLPVSKTLKQKMKILGIGEDDANNQTAIMVAMLQEALDGNVGAAQFLRETLGEDPKQKVREKELQLRKNELEYRKQQGDKLSEGTSLVVIKDWDKLE